jgi:tripartite-type tricarboxylate transporter receptor subunit TctC
MIRFALAVVLLCASNAFAQAWPARPIRWIVPTGPGSAVDVNARRVAPKLAEALGQPVVIENKPGANSMLGAREAARAAPDGYTIYQAVINNALNDVLAPDACCVLNEKLVPVTRLYTTPLIMVVNLDVPAKDMQEYVALAKAKPGLLTYASGGPGSITQMLGELLKHTAAIDVREIPYKAIGAELPDLTGGHVSTAYLSPVVIREHVRAGRLRALAVAARERLVNLPDIPTMAEAGFPGIEASGWNGIFVPAGTPPAIIDRLQEEIDKVLHMKDVQDDAYILGTVAGGEKPGDFAAFVRGEKAKWSQVVKQAGIRIEQ